MKTASGLITALGHTLGDGASITEVVGSDPFFEESIELLTPQSQDYVEHNLLLLGYTEIPSGSAMPSEEGQVIVGYVFANGSRVHSFRALIERSVAQTIISGKVKFGEAVKVFNAARRDQGTAACNSDRDLARDLASGVGAGRRRPTTRAREGHLGRGLGRGLGRSDGNALQELYWRERHWRGGWRGCQCGS